MDDPRWVAVALAAGISGIMYTILLIAERRAARPKSQT